MNLEGRHESFGEELEREIIDFWASLIYFSEKLLQHILLETSFQVYSGISVLALSVLYSFCLSDIQS